MKTQNINNISLYLVISNDVIESFPVFYFYYSVHEAYARAEDLFYRLHHYNVVVYNINLMNLKTSVIKTYTNENWKELININL